MTSARTLAAAGAAVLACALTAHAQDAAPPPEPPVEEHPLRALDRAVTSLVERAAPAVVRVDVERSVRLQARGGDAASQKKIQDLLSKQEIRETISATGFLVRPPDGGDDALVLTTGAAVDRNVRSIVVTLACGTERQGHVVGEDPLARVVLLRIEPVEGVEPIALAATTASPGALALLVGNAIRTPPTLELGLVTDARRAVGRHGTFLLAGVPVQPGDAGGPLLDAAGRVMGMAVVVKGNASNRLLELRRRHVDPSQGIDDSDFKTSFFNDDSDAISTFVPSGDLRRIVGDLLEYGRVRRGMLGVILAPGRDPVVERVLPYSPAARAGLQSGDAVVTIDGCPVDDRMGVIVDVQRRAPGSTVELRVRDADGFERNLAVVLGELPQGPVPNAVFNGIGVREPDGENAVTGVVVATVEPGSAAAVAGLRDGDRLVSIDGEPVDSADDYIRLAIRRETERRPVCLGIVRDGEEVTLTLR